MPPALNAARAQERRTLLGLSATTVRNGSDPPVSKTANVPTPRWENFTSAFEELERLTRAWQLRQ